MFTGVRFSPSMTKNDMINALNENFALLENLNRTQVFRDETGKNRIIIGRWPDGQYGLLISKPGVDVLSLFK